MAFSPTAAAFIEQAGEEAFGQQADVLGEHGDDGLENVAAGAGAVFAAADHGVEGIGDALRGFAGDGDPVVAKEGRELAREKKIQRGIGGQRVGRLRFAFLVAFELRRKLGEFVEGTFL